MNGLTRITPRPLAVTVAITELMELAVQIETQRAKLEGISLELSALGCDVLPIVDASHDLEHSWRHLTSVRRALLMAWPVEDEG